MMLQAQSPESRVLDMNGQPCNFCKLGGIFLATESEVLKDTVECLSCGAITGRYVTYWIGVDWVK